MIRFLPHILFIAGSLFLLAGTVFFAEGVSPMNKPRKIARLYNETCYQTRFNLAELKKRLDKAAEQGFTVSLPEQREDD